MIAPEKKCEIISLGKKMMPKLVVLQSRKKLRVLEKQFRKKSPSSLFLQIRPTKRCAETFFKINGSRDI